MWENETIVLVTSLKKRILDGKDRVRFGKISSDNAVPTFIKNLFKNRVETFISKESPLSIKATPHFDLQPDELGNLKNRFLDVFREAAVFDDKDVEWLLKEALVLRLNYLVRPSDTMRKILFKEKKTVDFSDMDEALNSFKKALPYAEEFLKECKSQGRYSLNQEEFGQVVADILHRMTEKDSIKVVLQDLSVLTDFMSETKGEEITRVEGTVLQDFLVDRNLWGFRKALDIEMKLGKEDFDVMDLEMIMKRYMELKEEFSKSVPEKDQEMSTEQIEDEKLIIEEEERVKKIEKVEVKEKIEEEPQESQEKAESFVISDTEGLDLDEALVGDAVTETLEDEEVNEVLEEKKEKKPMRIIRRSQKNEEEREVELIEDVSTREAAKGPSEKNGLRIYIDGKMEKVFVKKLFGGDGVEYEQLIDKLEEAESWRVAKILIDNELFKRDVDPFSREAIKLVDLVYSLYYPEEGVGGKK